MRLLPPRKRKRADRARRAGPPLRLCFLQRWGAEDSCSDKAGGSSQMIWNSLLIKITYTGNPSEETHIVQEIEHPQGMPASYLRFVGEQRPAGEHMRHRIDGRQSTVQFVE